MENEHNTDIEGEAIVTSQKESVLKRINTKTAIIVAVVVILAALAYAYKSIFIAATVDGAPVSRLAVLSKLEKAYGKATLDLLIIEELIENETKKQNITVTTEEIDAEIAKIEAQIAAQGANIDELLTAQGMTRDDLKEQIVLQKKLDKMISGQVLVADAEVDEYIAAAKITVPRGEEGTAMRAQIMEQLKAERSAEESQKFLDSLRTAAKINRFVWY